MSSTSRWVVGAVIVDALNAPSKVLAARRADVGPADDGWEFPGGKLEPGETPRAALARELAEELGVIAAVGPEVDEARGGWCISDALTLRLFLAETSEAPVAGTDHNEIRWVGLDELASVGWTSVDRAALPAVEAALRARRVGGGVPVNRG